MKKNVLLIALLSTLAAGSALANSSHTTAPTGKQGMMRDHGRMGGGMHRMDPAQMSEHIFEKADANKDGKITLDEAKTHAPHLALIFNSIDTNKEGFINKDKLAAFGKKMGEAHQQERTQHFDEMFKTTDKNSDGALTKDEVSDHKMLSKDFAQIDANRDGKITKEEMQASIQKHDEQMKDHRDGGRGHDGKGRGGKGHKSKGSQHEGH